MNTLLVFLESITILSIVKLLVITLLVVYAVFALLMMRQIASMTRAVTIKDDAIIRILGLIHFVFAALIVVAAFVLL